MSLLIDRVEIYQASIRLKEPFIISLGALDHADNIFIIIRTKQGITGFGECSPFRTIHGESMESCFVNGNYLARALIGKDALNIPEASMHMDKIIYGNSSIKSAFDMALHDIAAQHAGLPLWKFLGGKKNKIISTDYTVSIAGADKMAADALKIKQRGFPVLKVKLGGTADEDLLRIKSIRSMVGNEIPIRIDANQGWDKDTAIRILNELSSFNIQHCEEPIPRSHYMQLPEVRGHSPIPIMADESCFDHHDAERLHAIKACDLINIKIGKSAGLYKAMKIIRLAEGWEMNLQIGGFLESRLGFSASAHLALASDRIIYFDFDTPLMFSEDPVVGGIRYLENGIIDIPDSPGIGATVNPEFLSSRTVKSIIS